MSETAKLSMMRDVLTHLIDATGDDSVSLRRVLILVDVDENPQTTQAELLGRLDEDKSTISRNIDWLHDHGCLERKTDPLDARVFHLRSSDFSSRHLGYALNFFGGDHKLLKKFISHVIVLFENKMPSLREALILTTLGAMDGAVPSSLNDQLDTIPASTQRRITAALIEDGLIDKHG